MPEPDISSSEPTTEPKPRRTRLHRWNEEHGAEMRVVRGTWVPWRYDGESGDDSVQLSLLDLSDHDRLELVGEDRRRFLGGLITCDAAHLESGGGSYGFVTTLKGKVLADVAVAEFDDRTFLLLPPGRAEVVRTHLAKYIVADRVEILPLDDLVPLAVLGAGAPEALESLAAWPEIPWGTHEATLFDSEMPVSRHERLGFPALVLWVSSSIVDLVASELVEEGVAAPMGRERLDLLRVEQGLPWFGIDYDEAALPQETGIDAVDYTKGCYLGQEVIARLHYRGQAPRLMRRLRLEPSADGVASPEVPAPVMADGRPAGTLTTRAGSAGLARLQRRVEPGDTVFVGGDADADGATSAVVEPLETE